MRNESKNELGEYFGVNKYYDNKSDNDLEEDSALEEIMANIFKIMIDVKLLMQINALTENITKIPDILKFYGISKQGKM
ncbi:hypothetical protein Glove_194g153 [Diversispora epigaea]|uniref:Uncharacterized protein n=1 Tax=Diversispora epigaea TaxID=1348612 RepID=A0A397IL25_9GLOM|nr:hypothetical protein Glove_194g153 [Diversispora epigaea]